MKIHYIVREHGIPQIWESDFGHVVRMVRVHVRRGWVMTRRRSTNGKKLNRILIHPGLDELYPLVILELETPK